MNRPLVSVVMAVYNGDEHISAQIESLLAQTYDNLELIIVDDGSRDKSVEIINEYAKRDRRIKFYQNPRNLGITDNFFKAMSYTRGEFICFCDQDDHWLPEKVELLKSIMDRDDRNVLAYSDLEICDDNLIATHGSFWKASGIKPRNGYVGDAALLRNIMPGCSMMFRGKIRDILDGIKRPLPYMHDHIVFITAALSGRIVYSRDKLVKYRQHKGNNIGAFYASVVNSEKIANKLEAGIDYFTRNIKTGKKMDLNGTKRFLEALRGGGLFLRLSGLRYYLFIKNDRVADKCLGIVECISPAVYSWLRDRFGGDRKHLFRCFPIWITRLAFMSWVIIVFYVFIVEFVMQKISRNMGG